MRIVDVHLNLKFPVRELENSDHLMPFVNSSSGAFMDSVVMNGEASGPGAEIYVVFFANLLIPGNKWASVARAPV